MPKSKEKTLADTAGQNENFNHPISGGLSEKLVMQQLQEQRRCEEEEILSEKEVKDIVP